MLAALDGASTSLLQNASSGSRTQSATLSSDASRETLKTLGNNTAELGLGLTAQSLGNYAQIEGISRHLHIVEATPTDIRFHKTSHHCTTFLSHGLPMNDERCLSMLLTYLPSCKKAVGRRQPLNRIYVLQNRTELVHWLSRRQHIEACQAQIVLALRHQQGITYKRILRRLSTAGSAANWDGRPRTGGHIRRSHHHHHQDLAARRRSRPWGPQGCLHPCLPCPYHHLPCQSLLP